VEAEDADSWCFLGDDPAPVNSVSSLPLSPPSLPLLEQPEMASSGGMTAGAVRALLACLFLVQRVFF
jgi:hypothetical protein